MLAGLPNNLCKAIATADGSKPKTMMTPAVTDKNVHAALMIFAKVPCGAGGMFVPHAER